jgi:very-short-patch-repair endonuclease
MIERLNDKVWLCEQYHTNQRSLQNIADELGTNRQRVRRALIKHGIAIRGKSAAQKAALKSGRAEHPTEGKERSEDVRIRIAESVAEDWANADEATLKARSDKAKLQWQNMSQQERDTLLKSARDAVRLTAKEGSQVEKFLRDGLTKANYNVQYHVVGLIPNNRLEVDLFLPELATAIEVDGPSHFLPIWGEEKLQRNIQADFQKTGLLLAQGLVIIRVKQVSSNVSTLLKRKILAVVHEAVKQIEKKFPAKNKRLIELEV